ncbi:hypothetical protein [Streptomyces sp. NPDC090445]|uniref:hypothetical protein n=1 Tax=Streptomyces sp. NPDC090445 TaxID=3365963 RepID=UPI0037F76410
MPVPVVVALPVVVAALPADAVVAGCMGVVAVPAPPRMIVIVVVHAHGVPRLFGSDA